MGKRIVPKIQNQDLLNLSIRHGFYTRVGGVSPAPYNSLNISVSTGDTLENVQENRCRIAQDMGYPTGALMRVKQVHSAKVVCVTPGQATEDIEADALLTCHRGILLGMSTADCVPILMADPMTSVIAAIHAGWEGALKGVIQNTVHEMINLGANPTQIVAVIGPCIHQKNYEVGDDFRRRFLEMDPESQAFFKVIQEKLCFDLPGYVQKIIASQMIVHIHPSTHNTYTEKEAFFSHRRATHEKTATGRQLSVIGL